MIRAILSTCYSYYVNVAGMQYIIIEIRNARSSPSPHALGCGGMAGREVIWSRGTLHLDFGCPRHYSTLDAGRWTVQDTYYSNKPMRCMDLTMSKNHGIFP